MYRELKKRFNYLQDIFKNGEENTSLDYCIYVVFLYAYELINLGNKKRGNVPKENHEKLKQTSAMFAVEMDIFLKQNYDWLDELHNKYDDKK